MDVLIYFMVYAGSALMAFNVYLYMRFAKKIRQNENWDRESKVLNIPILLLVLFLAGYLAVGIFGKPDVIMAAILFGGSIFVFVMLWLIQRTVDRIKENEHLEAKLSAAEEANRAKTFFLSNMSHDLRTPLNAIIGYTALAEKEEQISDTQKDYIHKIDKAGHQLLEIVNAVLEMSRIESDRLEPQLDRINLAECIRETGDLIRNQMTEKMIAFTVSCEIADPWVSCDKNLLNRVLMNLLSNAVKFTGEGGSVSLTLTETGTEDGRGPYEFRVKDTGIGMSPEFVERLFLPFERERTSTVSKIQGTGLGMTITKSIVERMGGTIDVKTEVGKGTEFTIRAAFPIEAPEPAPEEGTEDPGEIRFDGKRSFWSRTTRSTPRSPR